MLNQWNNRFYNALQERNWDAFVYELGVLLRTGGRLYRACGLPALSQSMAADPLAALDDAAISRSLARRAPTTTACSPRRCRRQSRPAHCRGRSSCSSIVTLTLSDRAAQRDRHALLVRRDPVDAFGARPAAFFGASFAIPGYLGLGGARSCGGRNHADPSRRHGRWFRSISASSVSRPISASTSSGCGRTRSRLPCSSGETAERERAARPLRPRSSANLDCLIMQRTKRLIVPDCRLHPGLGRLSVHCDQPGLFRRRGSARRVDADGVRLQQRADGAVVLHQRLSAARGMAGGDRRGSTASTSRSRRGQRRATATAGDRGLPRKRGKRRRRDRSISWSGCRKATPAGRSARDIAMSARRERAGDRSIRLRANRPLFRAIAGAWPLWGRHRHRCQAEPR